MASDRWLRSYTSLAMYSFGIIGSCFWNLKGEKGRGWQERGGCELESG